MFVCLYVCTYHFLSLALALLLKLTPVFCLVFLSCDSAIDNCIPTRTYMDSFQFKIDVLSTLPTELIALVLLRYVVVSSSFVYIIRLIPK